MYQKDDRPQKGSMSLSDLIKKLQEFYDEIEKVQDTDTTKFKETMVRFREFLKDSLFVENGRVAAFNHLITNSQEYLKFKVKFTHAENFFERIIELDENENIISKVQQYPEVKNIESYLTDEFNKLFYNDVKIEIKRLNSYLSNKNFVMVGCGSLPITLLAFCNEYPDMSFIGIDNSSEAVRKALDIKRCFGIRNLHFDIVDGENYDYIDSDTIFVANTVIPKIKVLRQIAMSAKSGTKIIIRVPVLSGNLLSEDVIYNSIPRIHYLTQISPDNNTDDMLYNLLVLELK